MIIVEQDDFGSLICGFKYYPNYIERIKSIGAKFEPDTKKWVLPLSKYKELLSTFKGELYFKTPQWEIEGKEPPDYSSMYSFDNDFDIKELDFKLPPFKYQEFGIKFLVDRLYKHGMAFICDSCGLGKTLSAIGTLKYLIDHKDSKHILIVCKKSIKKQWADEIKKFVNINADIYISDGTTKAKRDKLYAEVNANTNNTILIANYHLLLNDSDKINVDTIILDEVHTAKKYNGEINKACRAVAKKTKYCLFMTGTPIMSNPEDMYGIISIKDKKYFGSYTDFKKEYVTEFYNGSYKTVVGYKHLDKLREKIQNLIIRRTEKEVAIELPDITTVNKYCTIDKVQKDALKKVNKFNRDICDKIDSLRKLYKAENDEDKKKEIFAKGNSLKESLKGFIAVEQIIATSPLMLKMSKSKYILKQYEDVIPSDKYKSNKIEVLLDLISDIIEARQKVVCFTKYETTVNYVSSLLNKLKIKHVTYCGSMDDDTRNKAISSFQNNDDIQVFIATDAAAEGVNKLALIP